MKFIRKIHRKIGQIKYGSLYKKILGEPSIDKNADASLVSYYRDGELQFDLYKSVQTAGNKHKLRYVSADQECIAELARHLEAKSFKPGFILCHGTRNGAEQNYFKSHFPNATILGTEISDTATQFKDTIQWDFHEIKPEWIESVDLMYSNSWDHTYNPKILFQAWGRCISKAGYLVLEHSKGHLPDGRTPLDPFGATVDGLERLIAENSSLRLHEVVETSDVIKIRKFLLFRPT